MDTFSFPDPTSIYTSELTTLVDTLWPIRSERARPELIRIIRS